MNIVRFYFALGDEDQRTLEELLIQALQNRFDELEENLTEAREWADDNPFEKDRDAFRKAESAYCLAWNERNWFLAILGALVSPTTEEPFDCAAIEDVLKQRRGVIASLNRDVNGAPEDALPPQENLIDFARHHAARNPQRRRGPPPERRTAVTDAMRTAISAGRFSLGQLWDMPQQALAAEFGCSRTTAVKALVNLSGKIGTALEQEPGQNRDKEQLGTSET